MPSIPHFEADSKALDVLQASVHNVLSRSLLPSDGNPNMTTQGLNTTAIFTIEQQKQRQIVATATSSLSLGAALIAVYWFFMMRRNFRRDLVLLLILGGMFKSLWFVVFSAYSFVHGFVKTDTAFCQANGYLLQVGFEQCDVAVLFMSMHMYYQIFPTAHFGLGHDGLFRVRKWVYGAYIVLPNLSAALAFINPQWAFMAQGGFCSLPLRPFWYRIALYWGPRYLIWCYVCFVAVRIYRYVGSEFKVFGQERDRSSSLGIPGNSSVDRMMKTEQEGHHGRRQSKKLESIINQLDCAPDDVSAVSMIRSCTAPATGSPKTIASNVSRRQSMPNWTLGVDPIREDSATTLPPPVSYPNSRRGSRQVGNGVTAEDFAPPLEPDPNGHRGSITTLASKAIAHSQDPSPSGLPLITETHQHPINTPHPRPTANAALQIRRRLIQRQLRLLFIYPCIYMILWILPLIFNIMNYTDYFAQHPIFSIGILQVVCVTIMTFTDVVVFCWRERPWRHIPGSDGTFVGSFMFWRYCFGATWARDRRVSTAPSFGEEEKQLSSEDTQSRTWLLSSLKRWSVSRKRSEGSGNASKRSSGTMHRRTFSGGSDRKEMEAELARERLALERADYEQNRRSYQERRLSVISQQAQPVEKERKEWFDLQLDELEKDEEKEEEGEEKRLAT